METSLDPIVKTVTVPLAPPEAFDLFTDGITRWWPLVTHSIGGDKAVSVTFEAGVGGRIFETADDGTEWMWGEVVEWEPPERVVFSWNPNPGRAAFSEVEVTFSNVDQGEEPRTELRLEHRRWENLGDEAPEVYSSYIEGWVPVLDLYRAAAS